MLISSQEILGTVVVQIHMIDIVICNDLLISLQ
jgi:hypothetical protein